MFREEQSDEPTALAHTHTVTNDNYYNNDTTSTTSRQMKRLTAATRTTGTGASHRPADWRYVWGRTQAHPTETASCTAPRA